jgi:hypothetical protein
VREVPTVHLGDGARGVGIPRRLRPLAQVHGAAHLPPDIGRHRGVHTISSSGTGYSQCGSLITFGSNPSSYPPPLIISGGCCAVGSIITVGSNPSSYPLPLIISGRCCAAGVSIGAIA